MYIKREDALKELRLDHKDVIYIDKNECARRIKAIPSADRPHGEWIKRHGTINCSVCKRSNWSACFEDTVRSFNFCPHCGARMKGADNGEDIQSTDE